VKVLHARMNDEAILKISDIELLAFTSDAKLVVFQQLIPIPLDLRGEQDALIERAHEVHACEMHVYDEVHGS
jgi:hypothetical protein